MKYYYGILAVVFFILAVFSYESSKVPFVLAIISWLSACVCTGLASKYDTYDKTRKIQEELDLEVEEGNVSD